MSKIEFVSCLTIATNLIDVFRSAILRLYAPKSHPIQLPISPAGDEPLNVDSSLPPAADARGSGSPHTPTVDLSVARISLVVQMICFVIIAFSKDASMFVAAGALGALATGYSPTTHSLSLELYTRRGGLSSEAGRLFGAMSVIQTVGCATPIVSCGSALTLTVFCAGIRLSARRCSALYISRPSPHSQRPFSTSLWP